MNAETRIFFCDIDATLEMRVDNEGEGEARKRDEKVSAGIDATLRTTDRQRKKKESEVRRETRKFLQESTQRSERPTDNERKGETRKGKEKVFAGINATL